MSSPRVSVIVPAWNAESTLAAALQSLLEQTFGAWEAIVVDDGSTDSTAVVAADFAAADARFRVANQRNAGVSAARNAGIELAHGDWLLFLDADDWLLPDALERLTNAAHADQQAAVINGGYVQINEASAVVARFPGRISGDAFAVLANDCPIVLHTCLVARSVVVAVGGFDPELSICADWDLWQRIARTGARFALVEAEVAAYRLLPDSMSQKARQHLAEGLIVIERGHSLDPRVRTPSPQHEAGHPRSEIGEAQILLAVWTGGLSLAQGGDPVELLDAIRDSVAQRLSPGLVAFLLSLSIRHSLARPIEDLAPIWPRLENDLDRFLGSLESLSGAGHLARRTRRALEWQVAAASDAARAQIGATAKLAVELTEPIADVEVAGERLLCQLTLEGRPLGSVELPICDGLVPASVLRDAIVAAHAWRILDAFYGSESEEDRWTAFLQDLWGRPERAIADFYDHRADAEAESTVEAGEELRLEVSAELPNVETRAQELRVVVAAGGALVGSFTIAGLREIGAQELLVAAMAACGFELCRVAVREGLLERPLGGASLRERLAEAAARGAESHPARAALAPRESGAVLARRRGAVGTSSSRRAALPASAWAALEHAARVTGEPVVRVGDADEPPRSVVYAPDVVDGALRDLPAVVRGREGRPGALTLPVLAYWSAGLDAAELDRQLRRLREAGFYSADLDEWRVAVEARRPLPGRPVALTFNGGRYEVLTHAYPLLERHGFTATVFVATSLVGSPPFLDWPDLRTLASRGIRFGSLSHTQRPLTGLEPGEVVEEAARSRAVLHEQLGRPVVAFAYPHGDTDPAVSHLVGASGYTYALTLRGTACRPHDPMLELPRIGIADGRGFDEVLRRLTGDGPKGV